MKLLPIPPLPNLAAPTPFLWGGDLLWRNPYSSAISTPLNDLKTQLPSQLSTDPRLWGREDVGVFLRWCEREFDLPKFEMDLFQMNGKALCLLTKTDLAERIPGAGDILHNILHMLVRDAQLLHRHLPNSPVTPTSRYHPSSPHNSHPPTPNWTQLAPPDSPFHPAHLQHFIANSNSVTLSPAPSVDSQVGSPPQTGQQSGSESGSSTSSVLQQQVLQQQHHAAFFGNMLQAASAASSSSNQSKSDSEDDVPNRGSSESLQQQANAAVAVAAAATILANVKQAGNGDISPPPTQTTTSKKEQKYGHLSNIVTTWSPTSASSPVPPRYEDQKSQSAPNTPFALSNGIKNEFFPSDSGEPNTNGRLLWDFLQQLLNDPAQRYSSYIAWKCRDTGVFKIVDPAGLAQLWGIQKNHLSMNYDKMSRALRYYYRVNILRKVQGERHCYQFLRNPTELKNIKNISLLRQQPPPVPVTSKADQGVNGSSAGGNPPSSPSFNMNSFASNGPLSANSSMIPPPPSPSAFQTSFHHLALTQGQFQAAAVAAAAAVHGNRFKLSPPPLSPLSKAHGSPPAAFSSSSMDMDEMPTDLSTGGDRKKDFNVDCYPLIRNLNGLTTIQLVKRDEMRPGDDQAMIDDEHDESAGHNRSRDSSSTNDEAEIDVVDNVSNSNCDVIRHSSSNDTTTVATDFRKYE